MPIRLIHGASFDPATTELLGLAYERACENVSWDVTAREALAKPHHRGRETRRARSSEADQLRARENPQAH